MRLFSQVPTEVISSQHAYLEDIIFDICPGCKRSQMASVPPGAYAAWKVRNNMMKSQQYDCTSLATKKNESEKSAPSSYHFPQVNKKFADQPPAKYNSKMMNSIWGLYNRYSVHNLKKITDGAAVSDKTVEPLNAAATTASFTGDKPNGPQALVTWEFLLYGHTY